MNKRIVHGEGIMQTERRTREEKQEEQKAPQHHLTLFLGLPLFPVEVLGGTGLLVPLGTPPPLEVVQYLKMDLLL